jgi:hypothetical protein
MLEHSVFSKLWRGTPCPTSNNLSHRPKTDMEKLSKIRLSIIFSYHR